MPSLTSPLPPPSKKRRLSDPDPQPISILPRPWDKPDARLDKPDLYHLRPSPRRIAPLPSSKRARTDTDPRRRTRSPGPVKDGRRPCLAPCHICHRRPTKKSDLDSFADCEGCGERTCFICMRDCVGPVVQAGLEGEGEISGEQEEAQSRSFCMDDVDGPAAEGDGGGQGDSGDGDGDADGDGNGEKWWEGGHRGVVCSRCCVEMGSDGEIACLGCLSRMEGV